MTDAARDGPGSNHGTEPLALEEVTVELLDSDLQRLDRPGGSLSLDRSAWRATWMLLALRDFARFHPRIGVPAAESESLIVIARESWTALEAADWTTERVSVELARSGVGRLLDAGLREAADAVVRCYWFGSRAARMDRPRCYRAGTDAIHAWARHARQPWALQAAGDVGTWCAIVRDATPDDGWPELWFPDDEAPPEDDWDRALFRAFVEELDDGSWGLFGVPTPRLTMENVMDEFRVAVMASGVLRTFSAERLTVLDGVFKRDHGIEFLHALQWLRCLRDAAARRLSSAETGVS